MRSVGELDVEGKLGCKTKEGRRRSTIFYMKSLIICIYSHGIKGKEEG